jgi:chaperonin GroES
MTSPIKPLADRVVAARQEAKTQTASGIYLPDTAKEKPAYAVVEAVGPDVKGVKNGDKIIYESFKATEVTVDGKEYLIVKEEDVLATV